MLFRETYTDFLALTKLYVMAKFYDERQALPYIWSYLIANSITDAGTGKMFCRFKCEGKLGFAKITEYVVLRKLIKDNHVVVARKSRKGRVFEILHSPEQEQTYNLPQVVPAASPLAEDNEGYTSRRLYTAGLHQWLLNRTHPRNRKWTGKIRHIPTELTETGLLYHFRKLEQLGYIKNLKPAKGYSNGEWQISAKK